jgi:hypothetical protein
LCKAEKEGTKIMHGIFDSFMGGGHESVHHDTHLNDVFEEAPLSMAAPTEATMQVFGFDTHLIHPLHGILQPETHHSSIDHQDHLADTDTFDHNVWHDVNTMGHEAHLHLVNHSQAQDSNGDGISDAVSNVLGVDSYAGGVHHTTNLDWQDASGHLHHSHGPDSDHDGWTNDLERLVGTDPNNPASHPSLVEAHHFPAGSDENLPGTIDVTPSSAPWYSV